MAPNAKAPALDRPVPSKPSARRRQPKRTSGVTARGVFDFASLADADRAADLLADAGVRFNFEVFVRPVGGAQHGWRVAR